MKLLTSLALTVATFAAAAPAAAAEVYSFSQDGILYKVHETEHQGVRIIEGQDSYGANFSYRVHGAKVTGIYDGKSVEFYSPAAARTREIASR